MKKIVCILLLSILLTNPISAETISLKGTVNDSAGTGIEGVKVTLSINKSFNTTDAQGVFTITGTKVVASAGLAKSQFRLILAGRALVIYPAFENTKGCVDVFSSSGRKNASMLFSGTRAGQQTVNLPQLISGLNVIRVTIGNETITQTLVCLGSSTLYWENYKTNENATSNFSLTKLAAAAAIDTLIATKSGYSDAKLPINSYSKQNIAIIMQKSATGEMPFVFDKEYTDTDCAKPTLPAYAAIATANKYTPDPFEWSDKTKGRIKTIADWHCRRAEILAEIMKYESGQKPGKPEKFSATLSGGTMSISCGVGSNTINLTATIKRPSGAPSGPIPAIINMGSLTDVFTGRKIANISFDFGQLTGDPFSGGFSAGNFYKLYPSTDAGYMARWAWGVSRVIDALEALPAANIDLKHIALSGCSYQGKIALYAGAMDERIALVIPHESGGGGTISWRYSDMMETRDKTEIENLKHAQGAAWYSNALRDFTPTPEKLPFDQDELMALCAPRALLCLENPVVARMGAEAAHLDAIACRRIYTALGIADRFGASEFTTSGHCNWIDGFTPDLSAFVDKFLFGKTVDTKILRTKYTGVDTTTWIPWTTPELK
jgi:hypothetical protein